MKKYLKNMNTLYLLYNTDVVSVDNEVEIPVVPDNVSYAHSPVFQEQSLLGRLTPIQVYTNNTDEKITFSIKLHEDLLNKDKDGNEPDIVKLVDKLKRFSYPITQKDGSIKFPKSYFQLGELMGYGIIKVSVNWNKPFRLGRYILVDIQFDITIEKPITNPEMIEETVLVEGDDSVEYLDKVIWKEDYTSKTATEILNAEKNAQMDTNITYREIMQLAPSTASNLLTFMDSEKVITNKIEVATQKFNYQVNELVRMYGAMAAVDKTTESGIAELKKLTNGAIDLTKPVALSETQSFLSAMDKYSYNIEAAKRNFKKAIDNYYKKVNLNMTPEDKDKIINNMYNILDSIGELKKEISGYGAHN